MHGGGAIAPGALPRCPPQQPSTRSHTAPEAAHGVDQGEAEAGGQHVSALPCAMASPGIACQAAC
eukprot:4901767-Amphidinium_carterae.2